MKRTLLEVQAESDPLPYHKRMNFKNRDGYTMIELLIVVIIISIITAITIGFYNNFTEDKKLIGESEKLKDVLELAKKKASSAELGVSCSPYNGYGLSFSGTSYVLSILCPLPTPIYTYPDIPATISVSGYTGSVNFLPLGAGTNLSSTKTITFKNVLINRCISVDIEQSGAITRDAESLMG